MKYVFSILLIVVTMFATSSVSHAKGSLMFQPTYDEQTKKTFPMMGLGIYEKLIGDKVAFNSWSGMGNIPDYEMANHELSQKEYWMTTRNQLDFIFPKLIISPGFQILKTTEEHSWNRRMYLRFSAQLW